MENREFCQNTGNFVCSSTKFPDSKVQGYCDICRRIFQFVFKNWMCLPSQFCNLESLKLAQGKCPDGQGKKQGKHREFEYRI